MLEQKKQHYEEILRRELDGLDNEFETLRLLSQELFVSANGLRFWKAAGHGFWMEIRQPRLGILWAGASV